jgi:hypothetical protein
VILSGAADTEHHEISVCEGLITKAEAMGHQDVVALLQENLEQEQHTLEEVKRASQQLAKELAAQTALRAAGGRASASAPGAHHRRSLTRFTFIAMSDMAIVPTSAYSSSATSRRS